MRNKPLTVSMENGCLLISIGIDTLEHVVKHCPEFDDVAPMPELADIDVLCSDIIQELEREEEDGTTPVHRLLDKAIYAAMENGSEGFSDTE